MSYRTRAAATGERKTLAGRGRRVSPARESKASLGRGRGRETGLGRERKISLGRVQPEAKERKIVRKGGAPPVHAAQYKFQVLEGTNGQYYISLPDVNDRFSWKYYTENTAERARELMEKYSEQFALPGPEIPFRPRAPRRPAGGAPLRLPTRRKETNPTRQEICNSETGYAKKCKSFTVDDLTNIYQHLFEIDAEDAPEIPPVTTKWGAKNKLCPPLVQYYTGRECPKAEGEEEEEED